MLKSKCLIVIAFAFTVSHFDSCVMNDSRSYIRGPFPDIAVCNQARGNYEKRDNRGASKCWKIPETE